MASMKYTKMWILLSEYNFQVDIQKHRDLICCICKSLLKNAQQSICGCAFCFDCIKNYFATEEKYCPGRSNGCKELMVNIERNMQIDHAANKKVANVVVKCPIEFCDFKTELKYMDEHIESHIDDNSNQGKFLREPLEKLKKEISSLRDDLQLYKKDSLGKEMMIMKIRDEIDSLKKVNEVLESEIRDLKGNILNSITCNKNNNSNEMEEDDDIDWQLEIFTDDNDGDFTANKKRRNQELISVKDLPPSSSSSKLPKEIREIIATEVKRQTEELRKMQNVFQEEIKSLKINMQNSSGKLLFESSQGGGTNQSNGVSDRAEKEEGSKSVSDNKTTRRKLRRDLPLVTITPTNNASIVEDQTVATSKLEPTTKVVSESTSNANTKPLIPSKKPSKVVHISTGPGKHPLHPISLLRQEHKDKRGKMFPNSRSRSRAFNISSSARRGHKARTVNLSMQVPPSIEPLHWMRNISPFELRIDNFSEKHLQATQGFDSNIFSQPFFSSKNGYKMCLRIDLDPNRASGFGTHLGAFFSVLRGEFDDHLPWPMKLEITISIIDQITFLPYTSRTFDYESAPEHWKYVFHRPSIMEDQFWFGTPQFVHFDFLFNNPALLLGDSILVRCSVGSL